MSHASYRFNENMWVAKYSFLWDTHLFFSFLFDKMTPIFSWEGGRESSMSTFILYQTLVDSKWENTNWLLKAIILINLLLWQIWNEISCPIFGRKKKSEGMGTAINDFKDFFFSFLMIFFLTKREKKRSRILNIYACNAATIIRLLAWVFIYLLFWWIIGGYSYGHESGTTLAFHLLVLWYHNLPIS